MLAENYRNTQLETGDIPTEIGMSYRVGYTRQCLADVQIRNQAIMHFKQETQNHLNGRCVCMNEKVAILFLLRDGCVDVFHAFHP